MPRQEQEKSIQIGLKPSTSPESKDAGWTVERVLRMYNDLNELVKVAESTALPVAFGESIPFLEDQYKYALDRDAHDREINLKRKITRRRFIGGLAGIGALTVVGFPIYKSCFSPEAQANRLEEEKRKAEEAKKQREAIEKNLLGLSPTAFSDKGWKVRYAQKEDGFEYKPAKVFLFRSGNWFNLPKQDSDGFDETHIALFEYIKISGESTLILDVYINRDYTAPSLNVTEKWILRDQSEIDDRINPNILVFENIKSGEVRYISLSRTKSKDPIYEVQMLQKVQKSQ